MYIRIFAMGKKHEWSSFEIIEENGKIIQVTKWIYKNKKIIRISEIDDEKEIMSWYIDEKKIVEFEIPVVEFKVKPTGEIWKLPSWDAKEHLSKEEKYYLECVASEKSKKNIKDWFDYLLSLL